MLQSEWTERTGHNPTEEEWEMITAVYTWHGSIPDVGGQKKLASIYKKNGLDEIKKMVYDLPIENQPIYTIETPFAYESYKGTRNGIGRGFVGHRKPKTLQQVKEYLDAKIDAYEKEHPEECFNEKGEGDGLRGDYFDYNCARRSGMTHYPLDYKRIACYAVTGGSEGHYIHVDIITDSIESVFVGKTFSGMQMAQKFANLLSVWLEA